MKNILLTVVALVLTYSFAFSQTENDKLFLQNETKEVTVKEVNSNSIKYTFPGEDVVYSISKTLVSKIEGTTTNLMESTLDYLRARIFGG
jgi:hypothetical protein